MSTYVIWMDLNQAKIFAIEPAAKHLEIIHRTEIKHHTNADPENHKKTRTYFRDILNLISDAKEILVLGPGQVKLHFFNFLQSEYLHPLGNAVVGVETLDHPTENQILAHSREFFKKHDSARYPQDESWMQIGPVS